MLPGSKTPQLLGTETIVMNTVIYVITVNVIPKNFILMLSCPMFAHEHNTRDRRMWACPKRTCRGKFSPLSQSAMFVKRRVVHKREVCAFQVAPYCRLCSASTTINHVAESIQEYSNYDVKVTEKSECDTEFPECWNILRMRE